jgi:hypothetical protein
LGNTFVKIWSTKFRKTVFRLKDTFSDQNIFQPSTWMSNRTIQKWHPWFSCRILVRWIFFIRKYLFNRKIFQPKIHFCWNNILSESIFQSKYIFDRNNLLAEKLFIYSPHIVTVTFFYLLMIMRGLQVSVSKW